MLRFKDLHNRIEHALSATTVHRGEFILYNVDDDDDDYAATLLSVISDETHIVALRLRAFVFQQTTSAQHRLVHRYIANDEYLIDFTTITSIRVPCAVKDGNNTSTMFIFPAVAMKTFQK